MVSLADTVTEMVSLGDTVTEMVSLYPLACLLVHWRDWFVAVTYDDREYVKSTATKYLEMIYCVSYESKCIDEYKNTGRFGLKWL